MVSPDHFTAMSCVPVGMSIVGVYVAVALFFKLLLLRLYPFINIHYYFQRCSNLVKVIERGDITFTAINANTYADKDIKFKKSFSLPPAVLVCNGSKSESAKYGSMSVSAINISATGFTIRYYNNTDYNPAPYVIWTAIL